MLEAKRSEKEEDAHVAMVAIQLGMLDDAERLYVRCGRYDLLNKMYQASGQWDKAIEVAQKKDRIHLKVTYLLWARQLEAAGELQAAIGCYEKADAHRTEVPRMLQERRQFDMLKEYITQSNDAELNKWMGNFCESQQRLDAAINYYDKAGDVLALVRVRCYQAQQDESAEARRAALTGAQDLVETSGNAAAALFLARQFETLGQPRDALRMYEKAGRYKHAVRVARSCVYVYIHTHTHTYIHTHTHIHTHTYIHTGRYKHAVRIARSVGATQDLARLALQVLYTLNPTPLTPNRGLPEVSRGLPEVDLWSICIDV